MCPSIANQSSSSGDSNIGKDDLSRVEDTDAGELKQHGYDYCYINLLSIFGDRLPPLKIRQLAAECTRMRLRQGSEFYGFLSRLPALIDAQASGNLDKLPVSLQGWDLDLLRSILNRGKGLILCSHHFGLYRHIIVELPLLGFNICSFIDKPSYDQTIEGISAINKSLKRNVDESKQADITAIQDDRINLLCIDDHSFSSKVAQALKRGEIVLVFIDGNTGWDGPWGNKSKTTVEFLGFPIVVKNGVARLAAALGAPLLSILTPKGNDNFGQIVFGKPITPPARSNRLTRDSFINEAMQSLYEDLGKLVRESPEQWESSRSFHRWRMAPQREPESLSLEEAQLEVTRLLRLGATFTIDERRFAQLESRDGPVWIDVKSLRTYKHGESVVKLLQVMSQRKGINRVWIEQQLDGSRSEEEIVTMLGHLKKLNLVTVH